MAEPVVDSGTRGGRFRVRAALLVWLAWLMSTLFGMHWAGDGSKKPLVDTVTHGLAWNLVMAVSVLAIATFAWRWRDLKFAAPSAPGWIRLLWFPVLYLLFFALLAAVLGLPPAGKLGFVLVNTLLVGLSEEWAFRGVLFQGLRSRLSVWPALVVTTLMFGGVHVLNVITTGNLGEAVVQAVAAAMSGTVMIALLLRTGSLWVPIAYHALWDFGTFVVSAGSTDGGAAAADITQGMRWVIPMLLVLPNFLYAAFLLRKVRNEPALAAAPAADYVA